MANDSSASDLSDLIPEQWFSGDQPRIVRMRAYQMARATRESLPENFPWFATARSMVLIGYGRLQYFVAPELKFNAVATDEMQFAFEKDTLHRSTSDLAHVIVLAPEGQSEDEARFSLDVAAGLVGATLGQNAVFNFLFENLIDMTAKQISVSGPIIRNPLTFDIPEVTQDGLSVLARALGSVADLEEMERSRVRLALHWYEQASRSPASDQFLKQWIALEAMGMDMRNNVRPLNVLLASAYGISFQEARDRFGLGRIFGFRSRIVHRGERLPIHGLLQAYLEALFRDVLFAKLLLPGRQFAASIASSTSFDLGSLLHEGP